MCLAAGMPTIHAPGGVQALQMMTDTTQQNNTGPLGGPVIIQQTSAILKLFIRPHRSNRCGLLLHTE